MPHRSQRIAGRRRLNSRLQRWLDVHSFGMTIAGLVVALMAASPAWAQRIIRLPVDPPCEACRVELDLLVTIGDRDGPGSMERPANSVVRDERGRFIIGMEPPGGPPRVFNSSGRFLQFIGRSGAGPGEYRMPFPLVLLPPDTVLAIDWQNARKTVIGPDFNAVRMERFPLIHAQVVNVGGGLLAAHSQMSGRRIFLVRSDSIIGSFELAEPASADGRAPDPIAVTEYRIAPGAHGTVWVADKRSYAITQYDTTGRSLQTITRAPRWFEPVRKPAYVPGGERPTPWLETLWDDGAGRLWVFTSVSAERWQDALGQRTRNPTDEIQFPDFDEFAIRDTHVDVVDLARGALIASTRLGPLVRYPLGHGLVAGVRLADDGIPLLDVFELRIVSPGSR